MRKIVDCFLIYNELDLLKFKLEYLYNVVDHFVIVESTLTHSGNPKPMYFKDNLKDFERFKDKIVHVIVEDDIPPLQVAPRFTWSPKQSQDSIRQTTIARCIMRGDFQRNQAKRGLLTLNLNPDDIVIISDADEIADRNTLMRLKHDGISGSHSLDQTLYYYNLHCKYESRWHLSKCVDYQTVVNNNYSLWELRGAEFSSGIIPNGGWHFSYFGNVEFIVDKIKQSADQRLGGFAFVSKDILQSAIDNHTDLYCREGESFTTISPEDNSYLPDGYEVLDRIFPSKKSSNSFKPF